MLRAVSADQNTPATNDAVNDESAKFATVRATADSIMPSEQAAWITGQTFYVDGGHGHAPRS